MAIANRCYNLSVELLLTLFLRGLHVAIRGDVIAEAPSTITSAVLVAMRIEDERMRRQDQEAKSSLIEEFGESEFEITQHEEHESESEIDEDDPVQSSSDVDSGVCKSFSVVSEPMATLIHVGIQFDDIGVVSVVHPRVELVNSLHIPNFLVPSFRKCSSDMFFLSSYFNFVGFGLLTYELRTVLRHLYPWDPGLCPALKGNCVVTFYSQVFDKMPRPIFFQVVRSYCSYFHKCETALKLVSHVPSQSPSDFLSAHICKAICVLDR